jgi:hypothetical protein
VAALIQDYDPGDKIAHRRLSRWRSLDPTPDGPAATEGVLVNEWTYPAISWLQRQFRNYIAEYSSERRQRIIEGFVAQASKTETLAIAVGLILGILLLRAYLRNLRKVQAPIHTSRPEWFSRLIDHLKSSGFIQKPGETPLEFATRTANSFRNNSSTAPVADVPLDYVEAYYETRFGDKELSPNRMASLAAGLNELIRVSGCRSSIESVERT